MSESKSASGQIDDKGVGAPFPNCKYRICDLPGQCISEGKCHHPVAVPPNAGRYAAEEILCGPETHHWRVMDARTDGRVATCYFKENAELVTNALNSAGRIREALAELVRLHDMTIEIHNLQHGGQWPDQSGRDSRLAAEYKRCYGPAWSAARALLESGEETK